ncbi:MAG: hypothetical protein P1S60_20360, partial [Anaerolineae bacterium]|nr:hypothetical protein [Anaerolineae bacterium]
RAVCMSCRPPQLEEIAQTDRTHKRQDSGPVVRGIYYDENARQRCQDGQGVMDRRSYKRQHGGEKNGEDNPVKHDSQLTRMLGQRDLQKTKDQFRDIEASNCLRIYVYLPVNLTLSIASRISSIIFKVSLKRPTI